MAAATETKLIKAIWADALVPRTSDIELDPNDIQGSVVTKFYGPNYRNGMSIEEAKKIGMKTLAIGQFIRLFYQTTGTLQVRDISSARHYPKNPFLCKHNLNLPIYGPFIAVWYSADAKAIDHDLGAFSDEFLVQILSKWLKFARVTVNIEVDEFANLQAHNEKYDITGDAVLLDEAGDLKIIYPSIKNVKEYFTQYYGHRLSSDFEPEIVETRYSYYRVYHVKSEFWQKGKKCNPIFDEARLNFYGPVVFVPCFSDGTLRHASSLTKEVVKCIAEWLAALPEKRHPIVPQKNMLGFLVEKVITEIWEYASEIDCNLDDTECNAIWPMSQILKNDVHYILNAHLTNSIPFDEKKNTFHPMYQLYLSCSSDPYLFMFVLRHKPEYLPPLSEWCRQGITPKKARI
jgi:hypothetical protein